MRASQKQHLLTCIGLVAAGVGIGLVARSVLGPPEDERELKRSVESVAPIDNYSEASQLPVDVTIPDDILKEFQQ